MTDNRTFSLPCVKGGGLPQATRRDCKVDFIWFCNSSVIFCFQKNDVVGQGLAPAEIINGYMIVTDSCYISANSLGGSKPPPYTIGYIIQFVLPPHLWVGCHFFTEKMTEGVFIIWNNLFYSLSFASLNSSLDEGAEFALRFAVETILKISHNRRDRARPCPSKAPL